MKKTPAVRVWIVNTGKVINTRRKEKLLEAVSKPTEDMFISTPDAADICVLKQTQGQ